MNAVRLCLLVATLFWGGCEKRTSSAEVLLSYEGFAPTDVDAWMGLRMALHIRDEAGDPARVRVFVHDDHEEAYWIESPIPARCERGTCSLQLEFTPGRYSLYVDVFAKDRCDVEAMVMRLLPRSDGWQTFEPGTSQVLNFDRVDFSMDEDDDGIENALEVLTCGRFDVEDGVYAPERCFDAEHPCCAAPAPVLLGKMTAFDGAVDHRYIDGSTRAVPPFLLDATEVTWGALERCLMSGNCRSVGPSHPARSQLDGDNINRHAPVVGLTPAQADELCRWQGKTLPTDVMWDFAAAYRGPLIRARYPWDLDGEALLGLGELPTDAAQGPIGPAPEIGCALSDAAPAANYARREGGCPDKPSVVGSYPQSYARRGEGAPVADLAGNVPEWTLGPDIGAAPSSSAVPPGVSEVYLRGGGHSMSQAFLENDFRFTIRNFAADLEDFTAIAGFRCAVSLPQGADPRAEVATAYLPSVEPPCASRPDEAAGAP